MSFSLKRVFGTLQSTPVSISAAVGIDIGRSSIKVVELEQSEQGPLLKTYGEIQLGPYAEAALGEAIEATNDILQKAIIDVLREAGVSATNGTLSLPLATGFVTVVDMVTRTGDSLAGRIAVEGKKFIPLPLNEVTLDWVEIGTPIESEGQSRHRVLLVALQNEAVAGYTQLLQAIELGQSPMELGMFSAARAIGTPDTETVAIIDCGAVTSKLYLYQGSQVTAIHRFNAGGVAVSKKLATMLNLDFAAAETLKREVVATPERVTDVKQATRAVFDGTFQEMRRIIEHVEIEQQRPLEHIYLSGGVNATPGIDRYVSEVLQRPTQIVFPFAQVGYPAFMEDVLRTIGPSFTNSLGAALRQLR